MDISKGDIRITTNGATGGGLIENETELNPKGYWITGKTSDYNIVVQKNVTTAITMEDVSVTSGTSSERLDSMNVSHADVTITLKGKNELICNTKGPTEGWTPGTGCALAKDGMDGSLTIQCEHGNDVVHKCDDSCGSFLIKGNPDIIHAGALGSTYRNVSTKSECGFANLTIHGGNITVSGGAHCPGIGSACVSEIQGGGFTKDIKITGGNISATGTTFGAGIGSGFGNKVDGITISGGYVKAVGGAYAPGIGASTHEKTSSYSGQSDETKNIKISGGDTVVVAIGDQTTNMPGIGSGGGSSKVTNVTASPDFGYQGYIQDGTTEENYTFVDGTPFKTLTSIDVKQFYTKVYFGPFRDTNEIQKDTKDQIGANHVISKTGGEAFAENQLKGLTMVTGKNEDGKDFFMDELTFTDPEQIKAINNAKTKGAIGEYPLTFQTPNGTKTTVTVYLKGDGTDAAEMNPEKLEPTIGADGFWKETGGEALSEEDVKNLAQVQGKNEEGTTYPQGDFAADADQLEVINEAKTSGKGGTFELTFTSPDGKKATVEVVLKAYDETTVNETSGEQIKGLNIISKTGGEAFTEGQLKELSDATALDGGGALIERTDLVFPNEEQIKAVNEAKTGGKTGDFPLTIETPDGTGITIQVSLRDSGTDQTKAGEDEEQKSSLGANHTTQPTGGEAFSEAEIAELCGAKGKNKYGNNAAVDVDREQLDKINGAKAEGKTGEFPLTFSLKDGTKAEVTVTLTGDHTVSFDPDGGDYQPKDQTVVGGRPAVEPKEPKKEGYVFEGWYYADETGKEVKWDFDTPVHENITLKAKWKEEPEDSESGQKDTSEPKEKTRQKKKNKTTEWNYKELTRRKAVEKTGDENKSLWIFVCIAGAAGSTACVFGRKRKTK
ncbi:InlB B-repeat-containing protein [Anaerostipes caccae]|uniref:InlB B-repeat-containing protein n=1 Tax=Anaerostipes caccae TaxID=105841 RepID=UPI0038D40F89